MQSGAMTGRAMTDVTDPKRLPQCRSTDRYDTP